MRKAKKLLMNTIMMTAVSLIINTVSISFNVYISRKIGAEAMGLFQLIMSVYMFAVTFSISGVGIAVTRLVSEELAMGNEKGALKAVKRSILYAVTFGTAAGVLLALSSAYIGNQFLHNKLTIRPLYTLAVSLPFLSVSAVLSGYFVAVRRVIKNASSQIIGQFIKITATIYCFNVFLPQGLEMACFSIILGGVLSEILSTVYLYILYWFDKKHYRNLTGNGRKITKRLLYIAIPIALSSYIRSALTTVKQVITPLSLEKSGISCHKALSEYGLIRGMVFPVIMFPSCFLYTFGSLLIPEISRFHIKEDYKSINMAVSKVFKITFLFSILICGMIFFYANEIGTALYKSSEASWYIRIFALLIPFMYFDAIVDGFLKGLNEQVNVVKINIIDSIVTIILTCILLPVYGIKGYVAVIFISEILNAFLSVQRLLKTAKCKLAIVNWILKPAVAIVAACCIGGLFYGFYLSISVAFIAYVLLVYAFGSVTRNDIHFMKMLKV